MFFCHLHGQPSLASSVIAESGSLAQYLPTVIRVGLLASTFQQRLTGMTMEVLDCSESSKVATGTGFLPRFCNNLSTMSHCHISSSPFYAGGRIY
jgi:hypothetical protein